jgi:hypothetical protein
MSAYNTKVASLAWIRRVRDAQAQHAEQRAADAQRGENEAKAQLTQASQACDDAMAAWLAIAGDGLHFDPELALSYAHVLNQRDAACMHADLACEEAGVARRAALDDWQGSVSRAGDAAQKLLVARRRAGLLQAEKQLAELADATAFGSFRL